MTETSSSLQARTASLVEITGGKPEWFATRKQITRKENELGLVWDGSLGKHVAPSGQPRPIRTNTGSWAMPIHGSGKVGLLSAEECKKFGLTPGRDNRDDSVG